MPKTSKKLTIKFYPNKSLKPLNDRPIYYRAYCLVQYGHFNINFLCKHYDGSPIFASESDFESNPALMAVLEEKSIKIEQILRTEIEYRGDRFELKGFAERYDLYQQRLKDVISGFTLAEIDTAIRTVLNTRVADKLLIDEMLLRYHSSFIRLKSYPNNITMFDFIYHRSDTILEILTSTYFKVFTDLTIQVLRKRGVEL